MNVEINENKRTDQFRVNIRDYPENANDTIGLLIDYIEKFNNFEKVVVQFPDEVLVFRTENELEQFLNGFDFFFDKYN